MADMTEWNESLGAAIEGAAECLPIDYQIILEVENGGYNIELKKPDNSKTRIECESLVDEIEGLVAMACEESREAI